MNMPSDLEISGRLFWQARELLGPNLDFLRLGFVRGLHEAFLNALLDTMLKCNAMRYHVVNFEALERNFLASIELADDGIHRSHSMLFELEAFLFQMKSALDLGVKMLGALLPGRFRTSTFEAKGNSLVRALRQYRNDGSSKKDLVDGLIQVLCDDREAWLEQAINLRDQLAHHKTFAEFNYLARNLPNQRSVRKPMICGIPPLEYMHLTYRKCIEFLQDFMCFSIGLSLPTPFSVGVRADGPCSVGEPLSDYVKFGLGSAQV